MIELMKAQMEKVRKLQTENAELKNVMRDANEGGHTSQTYKMKASDRPTINSALDHRHWALFEDTGSRYKVILNLKLEEASKRMELQAVSVEEVDKL